MFFDYFCNMNNEIPAATIAPSQSRPWHDGIAMMVLVALAYLVLNLLTPEYHDDFVYKFMFEGGTVNYDHPVRSIGDIFLSQVDHYHSVNGRSIVHLLVQLFTGLLGKTVFDVVNVLVFVAFILLLHRRKVGDSRFCVSTLVTLVLVLLMPRFKDTFLWMTGSINYLWSATAALGFLLIYEKRRDRAVDWCLLPLLIAAFLLGWTHEGITLPLGVALVISHLLHIKKNRGEGLWLALAYLAGGCIIALAPGTISRSGMGGGLAPSALGLKVIAGFTVLAKLRLIYLVLLATIIGWFLDREAVKRVVSDNGYLLLAMLLALGIVFASGMESTRTAFGLELFSMVYLLRLLSHVCRDAKSCVSQETGDKPYKKNMFHWITLTLSVGLMIFYALLLRHTIPSWQESRRLIAQIERTSDGIIGTDEHHAGGFSSFICTMLSPDSTVNAMNYDPHGWPASIAATYHCDSLIFLPQAFLNDLKAHPERYKELNLDTPYEFYVQRLDGDTTVKQVEFQLAPNDFGDIPWLLRPIARRMNRYTDTTVPTTKWTTITLYGHRYLLIKRDHTLQDRLLNIRTQL